MDRKILQVKDPILAGLRGATFLAAVKLGYLGYDEIPERVEIAASYEPDPHRREVYDRLYREYRKIYTANRKIYARLNRVE